MKLNNKGMSIVEVVLTFTLIMLISTGLLVIVVNYRNKVAVSLERLTMDTFKDNLTQDIYHDVLEKGVLQMIDLTSSDTCNQLSLNSCVQITFQDNSTSILGTSKININDKDSIQNKFIYYDGTKYKLKDSLPQSLPKDRTWSELAAIRVMDDNILNKITSVLEDGTKLDIYSIDIEISHIDFKEDFGIHIIASTDKVNSNVETTLYAYGNPSSSDVTSYYNYMDIVNSGHDVFIKQVNKAYNKTLYVCIYRNDNLFCFQNNNYTYEQKNLQTIFSDEKCDASDYSTTCIDVDFSCGIVSDGRASCKNEKTNKYCYIYSSGSISCTN